MKYKNEQSNCLIEEPSSIYSVALASFGIGLLLSGQMVQGLLASCGGVILYLKYIYDHSKFVTLLNDQERAKIISEISAAKDIIELHEARKQEMRLKLSPSELKNWMLGQKNIIDMWHAKIEILEKRLSDIQ